MIVEKSCHVGGGELVFETGRLAKQADGAVMVRLGDTMVLCAVCAEKTSREGRDFFPLTVDYREKYSSAGKYPGGFFKREGRPTEKEILTCRLIDRPIRPLFPEGFQCETQVMAMTLSADADYDPDILAMNAAFAALAISDIPFGGPLGAVRIGRLEDQFVVNPTYEQLTQSTLNLTVAAKRDAIVMVEGGARELPESVLVEAMALAQREAIKIIDAIEQLAREVGRPKRPLVPPERDAELEARVRALVLDRMKTACFIKDKQERADALDQITADAVAAIQPEGYEGPDKQQEIKELLHAIEAEVLRQAVLADNRRADGRDCDTVRPIQIEVGLLPRTHGSALFTRGQTQALVTVTLGTADDEQIVDSLVEETTKKFMLHYNFPPFSVGEVRPLRGPGRREIGHGALAERALQMVMPAHEDFPYTVRINSDILESNGSSSMATVCGGCLALMDAGVPIRRPVAGVAMGLISEGGRTAVLTDILGVEDHLGDMDFKICGTREGITAVQMDIKIDGLEMAVMERALEQARRARLFILERMCEALSAPREALSPLAPRIETFYIPVDRIRDVIGPGGKVIRGIIAATGVKIDIEDDGKVSVASNNGEAMERAIQMIHDLTAEVEVGKIYRGKVVRIAPFGCFVEILPGQDGLVHISRLAPYRVEKTEDVVHEGDMIDVKVIEIDSLGRVNLSKVDADVELGRIERPIRSDSNDHDRGRGRGDGGSRKDRRDRRDERR